MDEYQYMCISCGDLTCALFTTVKIEIPTKCIGDGANPKWVCLGKIQREEDSADAAASDMKPCGVCGTLHHCNTVCPKCHG